MQKRVSALFHEELGYRYLGDWADRNGNSNIKAGLLTVDLHKSGYTPAQIDEVLYKLRTETAKCRSFLCKSNASL